MKSIVKLSIMSIVLLAINSCSNASKNPIEKSYNTPEEIGAGVYELYDAFFKEVATAIDEGANNCEKITPIAEKYKLKIVELGKKREKLNDAEKTTCDKAAKDKANDVYVTQTEGYKKYDAFLTKVQADDYDCFKLLFDYMSINLYGNLENVKRSFPDEVNLYE